jgi:hypothetical protein
MLQCRFCFGVVEDDDEDGIIECECGARFPVRESLFALDPADDIPDDDPDDDFFDDPDSDVEHDLEF